MKINPRYRLISEAESSEVSEPGEISSVYTAPTFARKDQIKERLTSKAKIIVQPGPANNTTMIQSPADEEIEVSAVDSEPTFEGQIRVAKKGQPIPMQM